MTAAQVLDYLAKVPPTNLHVIKFGYGEQVEYIVVTGVDREVAKAKLKAIGYYGEVL